MITPKKENIAIVAVKWTYQLTFLMPSVPGTAIIVKRKRMHHEISW
jgi:hypothetical protein